MEERWHPDLVLNQDPQMPGTGGEFRGGGHIVTLRGDRAAGMNVFLGWDAARRAAGLDPSG